MEVAKGRRLDEGLVKLITGAEPICARKVHHPDAIEFVPEFKLFMVTNHKPTFAPDYAMARRVRLIPFTEKIAPEDRDPQLPEKLKAEADGILWRLAQGWVAYQQTGSLSKLEPDVVRIATQDYVGEMDSMSPFFAERCVFGISKYKVQAQSLFQAYKDFVAVNPDLGQPESVRSFGERMQGEFAPQHGLRRVKSRGRVFWQGIGLKADPVQELGLGDEAVVDSCRGFAGIL